MTEELYHNKFAPLYDFFQYGVEGDVKFYLDYFKNFKGKILEIGAGTGRITIPLIKQGLDVTALDIAPKMLEILREKSKKENVKIKTICADMKNFKSKDKFKAVIITFSTFQHLYSVSDQLKALENIKKHLSSNGLLIFDVYNPALKYISKGNWQWRKDKIANLPNVKGEVKIDYRNRYDMAKQMMYQEYRFKYPDGQEKIIPLRMRFFFRFELEHLLYRAGFKIKKLYGDFYKTPFESNSTRMVFVTSSNF